MARRELLFRVFVSSTFDDMQAERNVLQAATFPALTAYCETRNARFQAIDLRWGVSEEAALDQQTMTICLGELARCQAVSPRPNFIVLLGHRYGWRPLPASIAASEFEALAPLLPAALPGTQPSAGRHEVVRAPLDQGAARERQAGKAARFA